MVLCWLAGWLLPWLQELLKLFYSLAGCLGARLVGDGWEAGWLVGVVGGAGNLSLAAKAGPWPGWLA